MRLIDADALKLGIISQSNTGRESYSTELICEFIDEQPTVGEWIPADNPPEEDGGYLCILSGELVGTEEPFVGIDWYEDGEWTEKDDVIAWMPLPSPYIPEETK